MSTYQSPYKDEREFSELVEVLSKTSHAKHGAVYKYNNQPMNAISRQQNNIDEEQIIHALLDDKAHMNNPLADNRWSKLCDVAPPTYEHVDADGFVVVTHAEAEACFNDYIAKISASLRLNSSHGAKDVYDSITSVVEQHSKKQQKYDKNTIQQPQAKRSYGFFSALRSVATVWTVLRWVFWGFRIYTTNSKHRLVVTWIYKAYLVRASNSLNVQSTQEEFGAVSKLAHAAYHQKLMDAHAIKKFGEKPEDVDDKMYKALSSMARYTAASSALPVSPLTEAVTVERMNKELTLTLGINRPELIKFRSSWYSQRTPVDLGLNAYKFRLDVILADSLLLTQTDNPLFKDCVTDTAPDGSIWYSAHLLNLQGEYDTEDSLPDNHPSVQLLKHIHALITSTAVDSVHIPSELAELTYPQFTWWLSYALSHPYNWAFDRLSIAIHPR